MANNDEHPRAEKMLPTQEAGITPWDVVDRLLTDGGTYWLATVRADGRPHLVPIGAVWMDGALYFTTGQGTRKEANIKHNSHCALSLSSRGYDLVVEGTAAHLEDEGKLQRLARIYSSPPNNWPATVRDGAFDAPFSAPTTGPAPYEVYEVTPVVAFALGTEEETVNLCTRYRF